MKLNKHHAAIQENMKITRYAYLLRNSLGILNLSELGFPTVNNSVTIHTSKSLEKTVKLVFPGFYQYYRIPVMAGITLYRPSILHYTVLTMLWYNILGVLR